MDPDLRLEAPLDQIRNRCQVVLVALSPLDLDQQHHDGTKPLTCLGSLRVVLACLSRPALIGGWDSLARRPLAIRSLLPPGSVLFCEIADSERFDEAVASRPGVAHIGRAGNGASASQRSASGPTVLANSTGHVDEPVTPS